MSRQKTLFLGGVPVESHRGLTHDQPIRSLSLPSVAVLPLIQFPGARARWIVGVGDHVAEEQVLALGLGSGDLDVHSPTPGVLQEFREITLPGGTVTSAALIRLDGQFGRTGRPSRPQDWNTLDPATLLEQIRRCGVFLQSSTLDRPVNLDEAPAKVEHLVINGLQSEPYLTLPQVLATERLDAVVEGIHILQRIYSPVKTHFVTDRDDAASFFEGNRAAFSGMSCESLEFRYPQAHAGLLLKTLGAQRASLILDVASVVALRDAVVEQRPQTEKTVVLSGGGARRPGVYRVRIGTPLYQFLKDAGGIKPDSEKVLIGGPFLGEEVESFASPIIKSTQAVLVLLRTEVNAGQTRACIRCGACSASCPIGLEPLNLAKLLQQANPELAFSEGLGSCIECGICSYVCPSRIPLLAAFHDARKERRHG